MSTIEGRGEPIERVENVYSVYCGKAGEPDKTEVEVGFCKTRACYCRNHSLLHGFVSLLLRVSVSTVIYGFQIHDAIAGCGGRYRAMSTKKGTLTIMLKRSMRSIIGRDLQTA